MNTRIVCFLGIVAILITACGTSARIRKAANFLYVDSSLAGSEVGISIFDPTKNRFVYDHLGDHYFVPASNVKIFTCYAALKYLGDSAIGIRYASNDSAVFIFPTGDPSFLHTDFKSQPVFDFLRAQQKPVYIINDQWRTESFGSGWQWDDYNDAYSAERSAFPVYGNCIRWVQEHSGTPEADSAEFDQSVFIYSIPEVDMPVRFDPAPNATTFFVKRDVHQNAFSVRQGSENLATRQVPYLTNGISTGLQLLKDSLGKEITEKTIKEGISPTNTIVSRQLDSLLVPMMHKSDNFLAEQLLLMVSEKLSGSFSETALIDSLLKNELKLPGKVRWADGSGLSRYNLFTPKDFVSVLQRMQDEFTMERLQVIFPQSGQGTLSGFSAGKNHVVAKTGSMSGVMALSGFVITPSGKHLVFSILVNNHRGSLAAIRARMGKFLESVR
ncbi:MAG TPA: D-alanyl-D-alanine carboxypeptidase/D-alanyl-D-alanine-endopeptidase [Flavitalea sp.]|nr:D-alanyl-D-alanine carboxypeptidase/D-alanyl-D-alanine-endopeptidase [Flavitalea sp.]